MAVGGDVAVFRVGNLQQIGSNARQADGLGRSSSAIRGWHTLHIEVIHEEKKSDTNQEPEKPDKRFHNEIVARPAAHFKLDARGVA